MNNKLYLVTGAAGCNLRRLAATDAVTNGHPAVINGHLVRPCFRVTES